MIRDGIQDIYVILSLTASRVPNEQREEVDPPIKKQDESTIQFETYGKFFGTSRPVRSAGGGKTLCTMKKQKKMYKG